MIIDRNVIGAPVYDRDGHELGTVKDVMAVGSAFKINAPLQPDYWLSFDCIQTANLAGVLLTVDADHLRDVKRDRPTIDDHRSTRDTDETQDITGAIHDARRDDGHRRAA